MPRLAIAQLRPTKGDYGANLQKIGGVLAQIAKLDPPADLVVFPETATSGYFVEGGVRDVAVTAGTLFRDLTVQHAAAGAPPVDVAIGFYEVFQNHFYNSCLYASLGNASPGHASSGGAAPGIRQVHRKVFLPTYGVFDEERFVDRGREIRAFDTRWGRAAILICEDAWHSLSGTIAALQGAQLVIVPSASPARGTGMDEEGIRLPASVVRWERILRGMADEHGVWVAFASLVGFEGGKGFPGGSVVVSPAGDIVLRGPLFEEAVLTYNVDFEEITRARAEAPLLADLRSRPRDLLEVDVVGQHRFLEQRPAQHDVTGRAHHHRASGEPLAALEPHEARERHPHAVLVGHAAQDALPPHYARREPDAFLVHSCAACRRRARHDHELGPLERRDRARERVPRVLADQDRRPAPAGIERPDLAAAIHEALLVEHAVRGEEHLAVHLPDTGCGAAG